MALSRLLNILDPAASVFDHFSDCDRDTVFPCRSTNAVGKVIADWISISCPFGLVPRAAKDLVLGLMALVWVRAAADCCLPSCTLFLSSYDNFCHCSGL